MQKKDTTVFLYVLAGSNRGHVVLFARIKLKRAAGKNKDTVVLSAIQKLQF